MRKTLITSTAALAVLTLMAPVALQAQTAPPTPDAAAPQTTAPAAPQGAQPADSAAPAIPSTTNERTPSTATPSPAALPAALADLGITDATVTQGKRGGQRVRGTLPNGAAFMGFLDDEDQLRGLRVGNDAALPADILTRLVPQAVRDASTYAEVATVTAVMIGDEGVMLAGTDTAGQPVRAAFATDGTLQRFGRGEMGRSKDGRHGMRGDGADRRDGDRRGGHGDDGKRGDRDRDGQQMRDDAGDRDGRRGAGPRAGEGPAALDQAAARAALDAAGYTQPGESRQEGGRILIDAVNPSGENVTVELNRQGAVIRETAR